MPCATGGVLVNEVKAGPDGKLHTRTFRHKVIMHGAAGDTLGLKALSMCLGHSGYLGCSYCKMRGSKHGGMYFLGYAADVKGGARLYPSCGSPL